MDHSIPNSQTQHSFHSPQYRIIAPSPAPPSLPPAAMSTPCSPSHSSTGPTTGLPPLPRRPGPAIPVRRSSLSRACPVSRACYTCPDSSMLCQDDGGDDAKTPTNEDPKTPTNDQLYLPGGEVIQCYNCHTRAPSRIIS